MDTGTPGHTCPHSHLYMHMQVKYDNTPGGPDPKWRIKTECYAYQKGARVTKARKHAHTRAHALTCA